MLVGCVPLGCSRGDGGMSWDCLEQGTVAKLSSPCPARRCSGGVSVLLPIPVALGLPCGCFQLLPCMCRCLSL